MTAPQLVEPPPTRRRLGLAAVVAVLATAGVGWWVTRTPPLTDEERQFVGWWTSPTRGPDPKAVGPVWTTAVEYRADRTVRWRRENAKTGEVRHEVPDQRWRAAGGQLIHIYPRPRRDILVGLRQADFRVEHEYIDRVTWDGPGRFEYQRVNLPPGVEWPVWSKVRSAPPADAP